MIRRVCLSALTTLGLLALLSIGSAAWGSWAAAGSGTGSGSTGTLGSPTNVAASAPINSSTVTVSWTGATLGTGQPASGYIVTRIRDSDSATFAACGSSPSNPVSATGCDDLGVTDGTYHYTAAAVFGSWTALSVASNSVTVVNDASLPTIRVTSVSPTPTATATAIRPP